MKLPKRLLSQIFFFFLQNPLVMNYFSGSIYRGDLKKVCTPGLNCYSCPAAVTSCPIGATQFFLAGVRQNISFYVTGILISIGVIFGRFICGYVCPVGLLQDLLYKIKTPKLKPRFKYTRYIKYLVLLVFVIILPLTIRHELSTLGEPWFCKFICPSGTIFGAIPLVIVNESLRNMAGILFVWKSVLAGCLLLISIPVYRFFCRVLCPLGAIYALLNPIAVIKMRCDKEKCDSCGLCSEKCNINLNPQDKPNDPECVRCGDCVKTCPSKALSYGVRNIPDSKE